MGLNEEKGPSRTVEARRRHAKERRTRVLKEGGRRLELLLEADAAQALDELLQARGETATAVISRLVLQAARRRR